MDTTTPAQTPPPAAGEDKTVAIISYLTLIGFIVAIIIHMNKKTKLGAFHLRQMLGFMLTSVAGSICISILAYVIFGVLKFYDLLTLIHLILVGFWFLIIVLWIMGLIAAINGQMKPMPVVGPLYQKWFGNTFD